MRISRACNLVASQLFRAGLPAKVDRRLWAPPRRPQLVRSKAPGSASVDIAHEGPRALHMRISRACNSWRPSAFQAAGRAAAGLPAKVDRRIAAVAPTPGAEQSHGGARPSTLLTKALARSDCRLRSAARSDSCPASSRPHTRSVRCVRCGMRCNHAPREHADCM